MPESLSEDFPTLSALARDRLARDIDRLFMETATQQPPVNAQTLAANVPSKTLDLPTMMAHIEDFTERFHKRAVEQFEALFDAGIFVACDPYLGPDQMVLRVSTGRSKAVQEAMARSFAKRAKS